MPKRRPLQYYLRRMPPGKPKKDWRGYVRNRYPRPDGWEDEIVECAWHLCTNTFPRGMKANPKNKRKFCSNSCRHKNWQRKDRRKKAAAKRLMPKKTVPKKYVRRFILCRQCGRRGYPYCSRLCRDEYRRELLYYLVKLLRRA